MTTTPFLGCKISLISKSEIRYEGILYTIDPKESTIALAKVRSYGTEDRPVERQVPPREEIFEYIIFRAGDIKDLIVDDPPASIAPGLADPAIIQAHSTSSGATFPSSTFPQMTTNSNITTATPGQRSTGPAFQTASSAISSLASTLGGTNVTYNKTNSVESRSGTSTPTGGHRVKSPLNDGSTQTSVGVKPMPNKENMKYDRFERRGTGDRGAQHNYRRGGHQSYQSNYHQSYPQQNRRGSGQQNYRQQNHNHSQPSQSAANRFGSYGSNRQNNNYNYGVRRAQQSRPAPQRALQNRAPVRPKEPIKFDGEFDFDKAEKEFKELEEKMTNLKMDTISVDKSKDEDNTAKESSNTTVERSTNGSQPDKEALDPDNDTFYNKGKSFFDNISCEALERERGNVQRIDWKAERKLNSETFGVPMSYRRMGYRGRGFSNNRGYGGNQYRNPRGGYGSAIRSGGGGDTRRYNGPQRTRN